MATEAHDYSYVNAFACERSNECASSTVAASANNATVTTPLTRITDTLDFLGGYFLMTIIDVAGCNLGDKTINQLRFVLKLKIRYYSQVRCNIQAEFFREQDESEN